MAAKTFVYKSSGFTLLSCLEASGLLLMPAAAVSIAAGDALHDNAAGYLTNATTAFAQTFRGIAAAAVDNSGGSAGDLNVYVIPPNEFYQFIVPVEANALITQTIIGTYIDLESANTVDLSDTVAAGVGFQVDYIDVSTLAVAANTYGYAIGHFRMGLSTQA